MSRRRRQLARQAAGRILDLGGDRSHHELYGSRGDVTVLGGARDPRLARLSRSGKVFDTIVSVFQIAAARSPATLIDRLVRLLAPSGNLLFLEPTRQRGLTVHAQRLAAPAIALATGLRLDRDVAGALRAGGLRVVDLDRIEMATPALHLRLLVAGRAHHRLIEPAIAPGAG